MLLLVEASWCILPSGMAGPCWVSSSEVHSRSSVLVLLACLFFHMNFTINFRIYLGKQTSWYFGGLALHSCIKLKTTDFFTMLSNRSWKRYIFTSQFCVSQESFQILFLHFLLSLFPNILWFCCFGKRSVPLYLLLVHWLLILFFGMLTL